MTTPNKKVPPVTSLSTGKSLYIDGAWRSASATYVRVDPTFPTYETGTYAKADHEDVRDAFDAASAALGDWGTWTAQARSDVLRIAADILESRVHAATIRLTADMGKAHRDSMGEVRRSVAILRYFAGEILQPNGDVYPSVDPSVTLFTIEEPLGVVCAITPWNFPFAIPTWKIAPALAFGNSVVWKPADAASGSAVFLTEVFADAGLPPGALNLVTGKGREMSKALTSDPRLAALSFTGSGEVGASLRASVADRSVKVQLEMGGKNPAVILADADLDDAADQVVRGAMYCTGQRCTATSRVYVERSVAKDFKAKVASRLAQLVVGNPYEETTDVGPVVSEEQRVSIEGYLEHARREKTEIISEIEIKAEAGYFVAPTILGSVARESALVKDEIFGPVLVIDEFDYFAEALQLANSSEFGLSSAIFTKDLAKALEFIRRSESGLVHVNRETANVEPHVPFGGMKGSSNLAREQGRAARGFFTKTKTAYIRSIS